MTLKGIKCFIQFFYLELEMMMKRLNFIRALLFTVLFLPGYSSAFDYREDGSGVEYSLIVGKPYKVKYSGEIPESDKVVIGAKYIAYFKDYRLVYGNLEKKRILKVELQASDDLTLEYFEEIFVVVKHTSKKISEGVMWDVPTYNVCFSSDDVNDFGMSKGFGKYIPKNGKKCISLYKHGDN